MLCTTVRQILDGTEKKYGPEDAIRYKVGKNEIEAKSYTQLKEDSESFSNVLKNLGEQGKHISVIGATSYPWLVTYFGTVDSGSVIVPLDVNLPAEDVCDLIDRSDSTVLVYDEIRKDVAAIAKERCPKLKMVAPRLAHQLMSTLMRLRHISPCYRHFLIQSPQARQPVCILR